MNCLNALSVANEWMWLSMTASSQRVPPGNTIPLQKAMISSVSIVMSVYNAEPYLKDAINSILGQTYQDFEFIIIDDGPRIEVRKSSDHSAMRGLFFCSTRKGGLYIALIVAIHESQGEYIARMDADDISAPTRLEKQIEFLNQHPEFILVGCNGNQIDEQGCYLSKLYKSNSRTQISKELSLGISPFIHGSVIFRREPALGFGLYDEKMITFEDWELWRKMFSIGNMTNLDEVLYYYRLTPGSITTLPPKSSKRRRTIIMKAVNNGVITGDDVSELRSLKSGLRPSDLISAYNLRLGKILIEVDWKPQIARSYFYKAIRTSPYNFIAWVNLFLTCFTQVNGS